MSLSFDEIVRLLVSSKIPSPRMEARMLLEHSPKDQLDDLVSKRCAHFPLDKLLGQKDFYKNTFLVSEDVLSPRPDTEVLVEAAIAVITQHNFQDLLDLGTGSGCILLSILEDCKALSGVGVDQSFLALDIASQNAEKLNFSSRAKFIKASWFDDDFLNKINQKFDVIVSNPPYIPSSDIETLDEEVKLHDPMSALDGGLDGYDHYKQIASLAPKLLNNGGYIFLEAGINQAKEIEKIFANEGLEAVEIIKDLSGIERCVILKK